MNTAVATVAAQQSSNHAMHLVPADTQDGATATALCGKSFQVRYTCSATYMATNGRACKACKAAV